MKKIRFLHLAQQELDDAVAWYEEREEGLGQEFLDELDRFADEVAAVRARVHAPMLSADESALFAVVNRALPEVDRQRLAELSEWRSNEVLTPVEHSELLQLQQRVEALHAARLKALAELAQLRGVNANDDYGAARYTVPRSRLNACRDLGRYGSPNGPRRTSRRSLAPISQSKSARDAASSPSNLDLQ